MADYESLIPVNLLTGFLGSGKTTLLQRLLRSPRLTRTAVLLNEFGEIGLDHLLLDVVDTEMVLLQSGCVCCTIRGDLAAAIRELHGKRERGLIPAFDRLAIETTGLADPAPIVATLMADSVLRHHFRLGNIVTTVDAVNCASHLTKHPESVKQAAIADRLVLTKTDLALPVVIEAAKRSLRGLNPTAPILETADIASVPDALLRSDVYDAATKLAEVCRWLHRVEPEDHSASHRHADDITTFCLTSDRPLDWTAFGIWLTMLLHAHGEHVLRVKGMLNVQDVATPVVIHGVQHVVHPPVHLERWPDQDQRSRVIFIMRGLDRARMERSLQAFHGQVESSP